MIKNIKTWINIKKIKKNEEYIEYISFKLFVNNKKLRTIKLIIIKLIITLTRLVMKYKINKQQLLKLN